MLETQYMEQPRGSGTVWVFRMRTPLALVGQPNPRTKRPYTSTIKESLKTRDIVEARKNRDILLGQIRQEEAECIQGENKHDSFFQSALDVKKLYEEEAAMGETYDDEGIIPGPITGSIVLQAEDLRKTQGDAKAYKWKQVALGNEKPPALLKDVYQRYLADRGKSKSQSTRINLKTAYNDFIAFSGENVEILDVDRAVVAAFVTEYLPGLKTPRSPNGPSPATIFKKVSQLKQLWVWAMDRGVLPFESFTPWDRQAPTKQEIKDAANQRRIYEPDETRKILENLKQGTALGDVFRVALMCGVRLEEVASLDAQYVEVDAQSYLMPKGKNDNAERLIPLAGIAHEVIKDRLAKCKGKGPLFPEVPIRKSTGKRGSSLSAKFTRKRRDILGSETDGDLDLHALRHTWRTAARRAKVDLRTSQELGGWSRGNATDLAYDHGEERKHYIAQQKKVALWLDEKGYLGEKA